MKNRIALLLLKNKSAGRFVVWLNRVSVNKIKQYRQNRNFKKNAEAVLLQFKKAMEKEGFQYWISFGTLLGAFREKGFIDHDYDLDVSMYLEDYSPEIQKALEAYGFEKVREYLLDQGQSGRMDKYIFLGVEIDIFYFTRLDEHQAHYYDFVPLPNMGRLQTITSVGGLIPRRITLALESIGTISFLGNTFPAPVPTEKHLEDRYGNDFMTPNKKWYFARESNNPNITILHDQVATANEY